MCLSFKAGRFSQYQPGVWYDGQASGKQEPSLELLCRRLSSPGLSVSIVPSRDKPGKGSPACLRMKGDRRSDSMSSQNQTSGTHHMVDAPVGAEMRAQSNSPKKSSYNLVTPQNPSRNFQQWAIHETHL